MREPEPASSAVVLGSTDDWVMGPTPKVQRGTRIRLLSSDVKLRDLGYFVGCTTRGTARDERGTAVMRVLPWCGVLRVTRILRWCGYSLGGVLRAVRAGEV
ncbi:hypothetical protein GCM10010222_78270 [Streptomyces tanashiensis]|nr:hypothetical protein GCM10010222_78270 [Streptomyces tanashiensis]